MQCSSRSKPDFFVLALLYDARPRLLLYESWTVEKQRSVLSSPEYNSLTVTVRCDNTTVARYTQYQDSGLRGHTLA